MMFLKYMHALTQYMHRSPNQGTFAYCTYTVQFITIGSKYRNVPMHALVMQRLHVYRVQVQAYGTILFKFEVGEKLVHVGGYRSSVMSWKETMHAA